MIGEGQKGTPARGRNKNKHYNGNVRNVTTISVAILRHIMPMSDCLFATNDCLFAHVTELVINGAAEPMLFLEQIINLCFPVV